MTEYITKEQVRDIMAAHYPYANLREETAMHHINEDIKALPAADVVEVKQGEWKETPYTDYDDTWECSVWGKPWTLIEGTPQDNLMNYCPQCGAKMDLNLEG